MRNVRVPERTVITVTSNSGKVVAQSRRPNDARFAVADSGTGHGRRIGQLSANRIGTDRRLFVFGEEICPASMSIAQLAREPVRAVDEDPKRVRITPGGDAISSTRIAGSSSLFVGMWSRCSGVMLVRSASHNLSHSGSTR